MQFAQNAAMMNHASQELDAMAGLGPSPTIQIPRPPVPPINYNNQTVSASGGTVGAINLGSVNDIQVNLQALTQNGSPDIAEPWSSSPWGRAWAKPMPSVGAFAPPAGLAAETRISWR